MDSSQDNDSVKPTTFLQIEAVCSRYDSISRSTLWRWTRDPEVGFPNPVYIAARPFWRLADLERFEETSQQNPRKRSPRHGRSSETGRAA
jgi:predicted DNA-binding transcriptional regulator AlpA